MLLQALFFKHYRPVAQFSLADHIKIFVFLGIKTNIDLRIHVPSLFRANPELQLSHLPGPAFVQVWQLEAHAEIT